MLLGLSWIEEIGFSPLKSCLRPYMGFTAVNWICGSKQGLRLRTGFTTLNRVYGRDLSLRLLKIWRITAVNSRTRVFVLMKKCSKCSQMVPNDNFWRFSSERRAFWCLRSRGLERESGCFRPRRFKWGWGSCIYRLGVWSVVGSTRHWP